MHTSLFLAYITTTAWLTSLQPFQLMRVTVLILCHNWVPHYDFYINLSSIYTSFLIRNGPLLLGFDRYRAGARYPILSATAVPIPILILGCTNFLYWKCDFVWSIGVYRLYVCGVYAWKYGIGLKLQVCVATVLTVETGKWTTGVLVLAPILK